MTNWEEGAICSNPSLPDSDFDGVNDDIEYRYGSNPCNSADGGIPQPIPLSQLPPPKPVKFRLFTGVILGSSYSQISPNAQFLTPYLVNVFKKHKTTGIEILVHTMTFPANTNSVFNDITLPDLADYIYTVQVDLSNLSSSSLVPQYRDFSFIVNLAPLAGSLPFAIAPRFDPTLNSPLGALGFVGFNHGLPYNPYISGLERYRLVVAPIIVKKVISDQIAGNDANQLPTRAYGGQPNNPMVMAARSGVDTRLRVEADVWPAIASKALVAIREIATGTIKGSTLALPLPTQTTMSFNASNGTILHEVVSGLDLNANGILDAVEIKNIFEQTPRLDVDGGPYRGKDPTFSQLDKFFVVTQSDFNTARAATEGYGGLPYSIAAPNTTELLNAFATGANVIPLTTTDAPVTVSANGIGLTGSISLSLPLGGRWDASNQAISHRIVYPTYSSLAALITSSAEIGYMAGRIITNNKAAILAAATPTFTSYTISGAVDQSVNFSEANTDLRYSIGRCSFAGELIISIRAVAGSFEVGQLRCNGSFTDIYDFSWPGGSVNLIAQSINIGNCTKTEAGHATLATAPLPNAGRVFYVKVEVATAPLTFNEVIP